MALYLQGIAPPGGGADGEGDGTSPAPVSSCHWKPLLPDHPSLPAARAASSRPLHRGRAVIGDSPDTVHGGETGFR